MNDSTRARIGKSLSDHGSSDTRTMSTKNIRQGIRGEQQLYDMLQKNTKLSQCLIEVSLGVPRTTKRQKSYDSDVDIAIAAGNHIVLIDAKYYAAGKYYWRKGDGTIMEGFGPKLDTNTKQPIKVSKSMIAAKNRYQQKIDNTINKYNKTAPHNKRLPKVKVHAVVIFVPTGNRKQLPKSVRFLTYPGRIKSYLPAKGLKKVYSLLGKPKQKNDKGIQVHPISRKMLKQLRK